jgi:dihydroflavonol-4-reductase
MTGITGFLGTALAERLVEQGARVMGLVRPTSAPATLRWLRQLGVDLVVGDVAADEPCRQGLSAAMDGADLVIHSAAVIGYRRRLRGLMARTNVLGTRRVIEACIEAETPRMLHVSSIAAVGISDEPVLLDEEAVWNADVLDAAYFDTKHEAELEVQAGIVRGLDAVIVNPGAIYGPSLVPANSSNVVQQILRGRMNFVPPSGINVVPLETVVDGCLAAAERGRSGRRYILGGENLELHELVSRVALAGGVPVTPRLLPRTLGAAVRSVLDRVEPFVPDGVWFTPDMLSVFGRWMWFDTSRAEEELGVGPGDLDACLRATVEQVRRA